MRRSTLGLAVLACLAVCALAPAAQAAWPKADTDYADPILFPEQRLNNWFELQMTPVIEGEGAGSKMFGMFAHLRMGERLVWTLGLGRRTQELRAAYAPGGVFHKTYTVEMRSGWGNPVGGVGSAFVLQWGFDWSTPRPDSDSHANSFSFMPAYSIETRIGDFSLEAFFGANIYVVDMFKADKEDGGWKDPALALLVGMKMSYQIVTGGHAVVEMRVPLIALQPDFGDSDFDDSDGVLGDMANLDVAFGWRQSWGPLTGGLHFIFHALGDGPPYANESPAKGREDMAMMLDIGFVFY